MTVLDRLYDLRKQCWVILIIWVHHHNDVRPSFEGFPIAGFLIRTVAVVAVVNEQLEPQFTGDLNGLIGAAIVDKDNQIDHVVR